MQSTSLAYVPEDICLLHCSYMFHCTSTVVYIQIQYYWLYHQKSITATCIYSTSVKYVPATNILLKLYIYIYTLYQNNTRLYNLLYAAE